MSDENNPTDIKPEDMFMACANCDSLYCAAKTWARERLKELRKHEK